MSITVLPVAPGDAPDDDAQSMGSEIEAFGEVIDGELLDRETAVEEAPEVIDHLPPLIAEYLDPRDLIDNPNNARKDIGDLEDLKASMALIGILCPLVVIPTFVDGRDNAKKIMIGHRRKYAAIALKMFRVPCIVASDEGEALQIIAQLAENGHRVGLTASEEAEAYYQLTLLDWTPEAIAKVRAIPLPAVQQSLKLRQLPAAAVTAVDNGTLTLKESADLDKLTDDPKALARVLNAGSGYSFKHALASELSKRDAGKAAAIAKAELVLAGVQITSKPKSFGYGSTEVDARHLADADGNQLDPATVQTMPGFAAFVEKVGSGARTVVYCKDPAAWGYTRFKPSNGPGLSAEELALRAERERAHAEQLAALQVAAGVRHAFIRDQYGSAKAAKALFPHALRGQLTGMHRVHYADVDGLYAALGGTSDEVLATAGEDRLRRALVARWVCAHERNLAFTTQEDAWALDRRAVVFWYERLTADGYVLADAEATLLDSLTNPGATGDEDDEDEESTAGDGADPATDAEALPGRRADGVGADDGSTVDDEPADVTEEDLVTVG
ncbi:ParB/RepB/Spo0J family partition protein [Dactylosporangium sp. NPDC051485]|uniref:ParB/RepB/Spo0J family partition protein n=1 Tax=Dactylosporangium sp. NPDC051485 TaxID=3154846 RepID=UPI003424EC43